MLYISTSLNIILLVVIAYLCLKANTKKYGFFYAFVFTFLILGIISNFPLAMEHFVWRLPLPAVHAALSDNFGKVINFFVILIAPAVIGAFFPYIHIVPVFMTLLMIGTQENKIGRKQVIIVVMLNIIYLLLAYESHMSMVAAFSF